MGYAKTASQLVNFDVPQTPDNPVHYCDVNWHESRYEECYENLRYALGDDVVYEASEIIEDAPWYSESSGYRYPAGPSRKFLGVYGLSVSALSDSTREVGVTEGILSGGVLGRERLAVPRFRFRVMLTAVDMEGLEYGKSWLSKAMAEQSCSMHGPSCGSSDLTFFVMCPPAFDEEGNADAYEEKIDSLTRVFHDVKCVEGPVTTDTFQRGQNSWGMIVEFTIAAGVPTMFGVASPLLEIPLDGETIVQDRPFNYIPYPSAELPDLISHSTNPCLAVDTTGWGNSISAVSGSSPAALWTAARSTALTTGGCVASYRGILQGVKTGSNIDGVARAVLYHDIDMTAVATDEAVDVSASARFGPYSGEAADAHQMTATAQWYNASNVAVGTAVQMGTVGSEPALSTWQNFIATTMKPATATRVRINVTYEFLWNSGPGFGVPTTMPVYMTAANAQSGYIQTGMNYSINPSLETNATGWTPAVAGVLGSDPTPFFTSGRVTGELAASGTASLRLRILGNGTVASGRAQLSAAHIVDISARPAGAAVSVTLWVGTSIPAGASVTSMKSIQVSIMWYTAADGFISAQTIGTTTTDFIGRAFSASSLVPPANAAKVRMHVLAEATWASGATNSDLRVYVDAAAVTVP